MNIKIYRNIGLILIVLVIFIILISRILVHTEINNLNNDENVLMENNETTLENKDNIREVTLEAGESVISASDILFLAGLNDDYSLSARLYNLRDIGVNSLLAKSSNGDYLINLEVKDTKSPETYEPDYFIDNIKDISQTSVEFIDDIDWDKEGYISVGIKVTDEYGNTTDTNVDVTLIKDNEPPEIYGVKSLKSHVGEAVVYIKDIKIIDNSGFDCELTVDKSNVDTHHTGRYPVIYTATDKVGNSTSVNTYIDIDILSVHEKELDEMSDKVISKILNDSMSLSEKAEAIFDYTYYNIRYINQGNSDKSDWVTTAYQAMSKGQGDCFASAVVAKCLLEKIDIDTTLLQRDDTTTRHFWLLVNLGSGWYHFDACRADIKDARIFMKTDAELREYPNGAFIWRYDPKLYPEVETKPFEAE